MIVSLILLALFLGPLAPAEAGEASVILELDPAHGVPAAVLDIHGLVTRSGLFSPKNQANGRGKDGADDAFSGGSNGSLPVSNRKVDTDGSGVSHVPVIQFSVVYKVDKKEVLS